MTAKPVEAAFESAANLAILRNAANREPDKHQYYGGCVWCRIDNAEFLGGGAHEHALRLLDLLDAKDRELAEMRERAEKAEAQFHAEQRLLQSATDIHDAMQGQLQAKLDAVRAYLRHSPDCAITGGYDYPCNCGFDEAMGDQ